MPETAPPIREEQNKEGDHEADAEENLLIRFSHIVSLTYANKLHETKLCLCGDERAAVSERNRWSAFKRKKIKIKGDNGRKKCKRDDTRIKKEKTWNVK